MADFYEFMRNSRGQNEPEQESGGILNAIGDAWHETKRELGIAPPIPTFEEADAALSRKGR